jgi:hypothetical protein
MPTRTQSNREESVSQERSGPVTVERREVFSGLLGGPRFDEEPVEFSDELLDTLLAGAKTAQEIAGPDGLLGQLTAPAFEPRVGGGVERASGLRAR